MVKLRVFSASLLAMFVSALACNSLLGIDAPNVVEGRCLLNTDCSNPGDVCLFQVCSPPCLGDADCMEGHRCLRDADDNTACVGATQASCEEDDDCPSGNRCSGGMCRIDCSTDAALCLRGQLCTQSGVCRGTDPDHDPSPGPEELDGPCDQEGTVACSAFASPDRLVCEGGKWRAHDACTDGTLCSNDPDHRGECSEIPTECLDREPNEAFCEGSTRKVCGPDLVTLNQAVCPSAQHCTLATTAVCATCLPNQFRCEDNTLQKCTAELTGFEDERTCTDAPCSASAGDCTEFACNVGQRRCLGDILEECNADRSGFEEVDDCGAGLCDPVGFECSVCVPTSARCVDEVTRAECSADGKLETEEMCDSAHPHCSAGACVECVEPGHCVAGDCLEPTCEGNACGSVPADFGTLCTTGYCDGTGLCAACLTNEHCPMTSSLCRAGTCVDPEYYVGWSYPDGPILNNPTAVSNDSIRWYQLPSLPYSGQLSTFGFHAAASGANIKLALYDEGTGTEPGALLTEMSAPLALFNGRSEQTAAQSVSLTAGKRYWIAMKVSASASLYGGAQAGARGWIDAATYGDTSWPAFDPLNASDNDNQVLGLFIEVIATE